MTTNNCKYKRETDPAGVWNYSDLIGATIRIKSLPITAFGTIRLTSGDICKIEDIVFRISLDGKTITRIITKEYPDLQLTFKDIEVLKLACNRELIQTIFTKGEMIDFEISDKEYKLSTMSDFKVLIKIHDKTVLEINKTDGQVVDNVWLYSLDTYKLLYTGLYKTYLYCEWINSDGNKESKTVELKTFRLIK